MAAAAAGRTRDERIDAHIAQTVEHFLGKEEVTGSSPVVGSSNRRDREASGAVGMAAPHIEN